MTSIRKKLLRWLMAGQLLAVVLTSAITYFYVRSELEDMFDNRLRQLAYSVPSDADFGSQTPLHLNSLKDSDDDFAIQVWRKDGIPLLHLNSKEGTPALAAEGFSSHWSKGKFWRSFVLRHGELLVQASQPYSDRLEMSSQVALGAIAPVLVLIVVLGILVWISVSRGLRPLTELAGTLGQRRPYSLAPLDTDTLPDEVRPLVLALNRLLKRLGDALDGQRKFIADAAHELRTPLAAVQLQAQLLQSATEEEDRAQTLVQIRAGTARASHLVHQLLTLARVEPEDWQRPFVQVDLSALMKSVVADHAPAALSRQIDLGVVQDEPLFIMGEAESLRVMLGNLVDNAIRYTPQGGRVDVSLKMADGFARFEVLDNGNGIPAADRSQVFARFYRRPGTRELGSGLGLAIVQEVAAHHHGEVLLADGEKGTGLKVIVMLPITRDGANGQGLFNAG